MSPLRSIALSTLALVFTASTGQRAASAAPELSLGSTAPTLPPVTWLLGEPVKEWQAGHIYVLDFWATWCKPCIASMPHMVDVQQQYKDKNVHVVGLAIWPSDKSQATKDWVEGRATDKTPHNDNLNYPIADDIGDKVSEAFMRPLNRNSIPTVMIIDQKGRLAWIGHPMDGMDNALADIVAGTYDVDKFAADARAQAEKAEKAEALMMEFQTAQMAGDWTKVLEAADKLFALDSVQFAQAGLYKYIILLTKVNEPTKAAALGRELIAGPIADNAPLLNGLAFVICDHNEIKDEERDYDLAFAAANRANDLEKGERPEVLDVLARIHFARKDLANAVLVQEKAVALAEDPEMKQEFEATLATYREAVANN